MTSAAVSQQYLASPLQAFFATVPALLIVVVCFRIAGADSFDASSIRAAVRDMDWRTIVIVCACGAAAALAIARMNGTFSRPDPDGQYTDHPGVAPFVQGVVIAACGSLMFAMPLLLLTLVLGLFSDRSSTDFWSLAAFAGAAEVVFLYWATHRAKRTGMIHVHARPLLVAVIVTMGTMATLPILQHTDVVFGRDHVGRQTVGGWGVVLSVALAWGSAWMTVRIGQRKSRAV